MSAPKQDVPLAPMINNKPRNGEKDGKKLPLLGSSDGSTGIVTSNSVPVPLTPGCENAGGGGDDVHVGTDTGNVTEPPADRLNLVYLIIIIHGVGTMMPFNMFMTAKDYFVSYKLSKKYTGETSIYAANFLSYLGFASQIPKVCFSWVNIFMHIGGSLNTRIGWSLVVEVTLFVFTVILAMVDTSACPGAFFWLTMLSLVVIQVAGGIYENSVYGIAAKMGYTGAVVLGSNISGTFTAIISLITTATAPSEKTSAIYFFITALVVLLAGLDTYFALPLTKFYRFYERMRTRTGENKKRQSEAHGGEPPPQATPYLSILKKCFPQCFNVFMVFFVTLAIFPAVHSDVKRVDGDFFISEKYYVGVTCFLTFNLFAMLGNLIPSRFQWPGPKYLWIPIMLRVLFVPFFLLCNYQPVDRVRVFAPNFKFNDWIYWAGGILLGLTNGYFSSLAMIYCPTMVERDHASVAGMFGAAFLILGTFLGINFSMIMPLIIANVPL